MKFFSSFCPLFLMRLRGRGYFKISPLPSRERVRGKWIPAFAGITLLLGITSVLSGCVSLPNLPPPPISKFPQASWQQYQLKLNAMQTWSIYGLVGVVTPQRMSSAHFSWQQNHSMYHMSFSGPLGIGEVRLSNQGGIVRLIQSSGKVLSASNPEALMQNELGWSVPLSGLRFWIRGLPQPAAMTPSIQLNHYGVLQKLQQSGWQIHYSQYHMHDGVPLPYKIILQRPGLKVSMILETRD